MSEYRIYNDMDTGNIMDCLPESEKIDFVYECFECLSVEQQKILSRRLTRKML